MASTIDDDIDTSLPAETGGANVGKVVKSTFTACLTALKAGLTTAKAEITALQSGSASKGAANTFTEKNVFSKQTVSTWQTDTFATTEVLDATKPFATITATANFTFDSVTGAGDAGEAQVLFREVKQDSTGGRVASYNSANFEKAGASFPVLSTAPNARDYLTFTRTANGKWLVTALLNVS